MKRVIQLKTITLYKYIQSELQLKGLNEFVDENGKLIYFEKDHQFIRKIMAYDSDVKKIMDELFIHETLDDPIHDQHFKKTFLYRFNNRQINRQTIEAFQMELVNVFLTHKNYINRIYGELEQYLTNTSLTEQVNQQVNDGNTTTDSRSAFAELPQNSVNLDVDNTIMESANDNTINRNKQTNKQKTDGNVQTESKSYQLDQLFKTNGILEQLFEQFDRKCFLQVW